MPFGLLPFDLLKINIALEGLYRLLLTRTKSDDGRRERGSFIIHFTPKFCSYRPHGKKVTCSRPSPPSPVPLQVSSQNQRSKQKIHATFPSAQTRHGSLARDIPPTLLGLPTVNEEGEMKALRFITLWKERGVLRAGNLNSSSSLDFGFCGRKFVNMLQFLH